MAIAQSDGSIVLTTKVDTTGIKQGTKEVIKFAELSVNEQRRLAQSLSGIYRKQGLTQSEAQKKAWQDLKTNTVEAKNLTAAMKDAEIQTKSFGVEAQTSGKKASAAFSAVGSALSKMASYFIGVQTIFKFIEFSREAGEAATQQELSVQRLIDIYGEASVALGDFIDTTARAIGMSNSAAASYSAVYGNLFSVWADQKTNAELTAKYLNMTAVVASKTGRTIEDVQERVRSGLLGNTEAIEDLGVFVNVKTIEMTNAFQRMSDGKSWEQLGAYEQQQIRTLAILEQATDKYGREVAETSALVREEARAAYEDLSATWGQFVNTVLMPVLEVATQVMNVITLGLQTIAKMTGKTISSSIQSSTENQKELTDAVKETNKELKKSVASFDTIEILSNQTADNASNNLASSGIVGDILSEDMTSSSKAQETVNETLLGVLAVAGLSLAAIGLILIATGNIAWGVGFLLAGIAIFGVTAATLNSDAISQETKDALSNVVIIAGIVAVVIGILCCVAKRFDIGIALIVLGVAAVVTAVSLNWDSIKEKVVDGVNKVKDWLKDWGKLVLGVLLCFSGVGISLGLALIKDGAKTLAQAENPEWSKIGEKIQGVINDITSWIETWGYLVLGVLLCVSFVEVSLGISLIKQGVEGLEEAENPKWQAIKEKIISVFSEIASWLTDFGLLVLGVIMCITGTSIPQGVGLIAASAGNLIDKTEILWDKFGTQITDAVTKISDWLEEWGMLVLGIILCMTGVGIPAGIHLIKKGIEKSGESENPKWQTIGDKLKETINKIETWVKTWGLLVLGVILCFSGVGIPLGIGLIKKSATNFAENGTPFWDTMYDKLKEVWNKIKVYWQTNISKYFTASWWGELAKKAVNGFLEWFVNGINKLIEKINSVSFTLPAVLGGDTIKVFNVKKLDVPQLAKGAVLPANNPFLAVVGDQKQGTNIEAPAKLIKQMAMEAIQETGFAGGQTVKEEHYYLDETELMSIVYKLVKGGERLNGGSLVTGGAF